MMLRNPKQEIPLVYSCSGCSNLAQLANAIALDFDRRGIAEMSCIAGVGGGVKPLVKKAQSGRTIIALDGCPLHCVKHCLKLHHVSPTFHFTLTEFNLKKECHLDFSFEDKALIAKKILEALNKV